ncbi:hypothetical protein DVH24_040128 [Malus domestica]|uniref:Uncharacterized protein n=1 Tax=Malus domestica TaxID=3750 RepID=A0A498INE3_MALDO|nr:hypothetical protein DVH24_040128 [Malus domestica]
MDDSRGALKFLGPLEIASSKRQTKVHNIGARLYNFNDAVLLQILLQLLMLKNQKRYGIEQKENFTGGRAQPQSKAERLDHILTLGTSQEGAITVA